MREEAKDTSGNKITLGKAEVTLEENFLVRIAIKENSDLDLEDLKEIFRAENKLVGKSKRLVIFVPPKYGSISKEGREFSASKEVCENAIAKAIIAKALATKLISNVFLKINKPPAPIKLFSEETEAIKWLREMQNN